MAAILKGFDMYILILINVLVLNGEPVDVVSSMDFPVATLEECLENRKAFFQKIGSENGSPVSNMEAVCVPVVNVKPEFWQGLY